MQREHILMFSLVFVSCIPAHLQKYQQDDRGTKSMMTNEPQVDVLSRDPQLREKPKEKFKEPIKESFKESKAKKYQKAMPLTKDHETSIARKETVTPSATIYPVDPYTYRFVLNDAEVWDAMLDVLLRNYNLTIVDKNSGVIATEWDSYYLGRGVYRNKISIRFKRVSQQHSDVTFHNTVERLRDASQAGGAFGAVWLPVQDPVNEVQRIIQNVAIILQQPPPVAPPGAPIAKKDDAFEGGVNQ